jgi:hypothetical protein
MKIVHAFACFSLVFLFLLTAFIVEDQGISAVVMTARTKEQMTGAIPAFEALVASYDYLGPMKIEP